MEKEQDWEERSATPSWLDTILNGKHYANAHDARAQKRIDIMNWERILLIALVAAKTDEERAQIQAEMKMFRGLRR